MATPVNLLGYHLSFDDEFGTGSSLSQFGMAYPWGDTTLYTNNEAETYVGIAPGQAGSPFSLAGGALTITASPVPANGLPYSSGLLQTSSSFTQNTGYFEIRAEMPSAQGFWPAFWMLPAGAGYPEIDIMEQPNNSGSQTDYWNHTSTPTNSSGGFDNTGVSVFSGYHTYGFLWTATAIQYTFDGNLIGTAQVTPAALASIKMYLIANLAVGGLGSWPGIPGTGTSSTYSIDYIRAYSNDPTVPAVALQPISSPDGVDTTPLLSLPAPAVIGTGTDSLVLTISGNTYLGVAAQFTISIDGVQQGGTLSALGEQAYSLSQNFTILGGFGAGTHIVSVNFLNNADGPEGDRNLFVTAGTIDGAAISGAVLNEYAGGAQSFSFTGPRAAPAPVAPSPVTIGTGSDALVLQVAEDSYQGVDATFTISIDGVQQGGTQTALASQALGLTQAFTVLGGFGSGTHTVSVNFLNDAYGPTGDRNLFVTGATIDTVAIAGAVLNEYSGGTQSFSFTGPTAVAAPTPVTIGTGSDALVLQVAEDSYQGIDATFTISIDGVQQGGTQTALASQALGLTQAFTVLGGFGSGTHTVSVNFLNDAYGPTGDRNLFVTGATIDTVAIAGAVLNEYSGGAQSFSFTGPTAVAAPAAPAAPTPVTIGTGTDALVLEVAEDSYLGVNAAFTISIDGVQQGGTQTALASQALGQTQAFTVLGSFGTAVHTVSVNFLNNDNGPTGDRNLFVTGAAINTVAVPNAMLNEYSGGAQSFTFAAPSNNPATTTIGSGPDSFTLTVAEAAFGGNAQFTVSVDGIQQGGIQTATALQSAGQSQVFAINGTFGAAAHTETVTLLNGIDGGTVATDRGLFIDGISYNGVQSPSSTATLLTTGPQTFATPALQTDTLTVGLTEDAYMGDAQAQIAIDGKILGSPTVTFLNSATTPELFTYTGNFGGAAATHDVAVSFLNDAYGGSPTADRNLYVKNVSFDGGSFPDQASLYNTGTVHFTIPVQTI